MNWNTPLYWEKIKEKLKQIDGSFRNSTVLNTGIMILAGMVSLGIGSGCSSPWPWAEEVPVSAAASGPEDTEFLLKQVPETDKEAEETELSDAQTAPEEDSASEPGPTRLNMAFAFPDEAGDPSGSYAGKTFLDFSQKDVQWISQLYGNSGISPQDMARQLGTDKSVGNLDTWTKVNVIFYNGDGVPVSGYSNAKEILSLASVYSYYNHIETEEEFYHYVEKLWNNSHSYRISMSDVYYCDGICQAEDSEEEREAENLPEEIFITDEPSVPEMISETVPAAIPDTESADTETNIGTAVSSSAGPGYVNKETEHAPEGSSAANRAPQSAETTAATMTETTAAEPAATTAVAAAETSTGAADAAVVPAASAETNASPEETTSGTIMSESARIAYEKYKNRDKENGPGVKITESADATPSDAAQTEESGSAAETAAIVPETTIAAETAAIRETVPPEGNKTDSAQEEKNVCPGHVDLNIRATIIGLNGDKNLFAIDPVGNSNDGFTEDWYGWSSLKRKFAADLNAQDWYAEYGLTATTSMYVRNPLSASEIQHYMNLIPEGTSDTRRALVQQALQSVGSIPYYWGGKPNGPGFNNNGFGTITEPDYKGRVLRGLDCSGWIAWVYWSAIGKVLPYQSTSGLASLGTGVNRSALRPGDIIVRTGQDAHVYMFLAWANSNSMYLIHETGGITNNVTVGVYSVDWPYNRDLLND